MRCDFARNQIKAYIDGELGPVMRWRVKRHLEKCVECAMEAEVMADLTNKVSNVSGMAAPDGLRQSVLGSISFEPAKKWPRLSRPVLIGGGALAALVVASVLLPTFTSSKMAVVSKKYETVPPAESRPVFNMSPQQMAKARPSPAAKSRMDNIDGDGFMGYKKQAETAAPSDGWAYTDGHARPVQMIVKSADLSVLVKDFGQANDEAIAIAKSAGGYVTDSQVSSDAGIPASGSMTIKVPSGSFESVMERLGKLGKVTSKSISGEDVTGEYVDLQSQLRNKRAEERQYLDIMNKAKRVNDIVTVSNELYRVRGEIEEMTGRISYLKSASSMSTINLSLSEKEKPKPAPQGSIHRGFGNAVASLLGTLNNMVVILIWLAVYSPFWALPIGGFWYWRKKHAAARGEQACG